MYERLGVGRAAEYVAAALELGPQRAGVVDLAVEDHVDARVFVRHTLLPRRRQIDEGQVAVDQLALCVAVGALARGTTMHQQRVGASSALGGRLQRPWMA